MPVRVLYISAYFPCRKENKRFKGGKQIALSAGEQHRAVLDI